MHISIARVVCEGAYKPLYQSEEIRLDCIIDSLGTGITVECSYQPARRKWVAHFPESPQMSRLMMLMTSTSLLQSGKTILRRHWGRNPRRVTLGAETDTTFPALGSSVLT